MERNRSKHKHTALFMWVSLAGLLSQNLVVPVMCRSFEDQKNYYSPDPNTGSTPTGSHATPSHGTSPTHGSGGSYGGTPPSHGGSGSYGTPSHGSGGSYNPPPGFDSTPLPPSMGSGGGGPYYYSPPSSGGGGGAPGIDPAPFPPSTGTGGGRYYHSPPSSGGGGGHTPTPPFDPTPSTPSTGSGGGGYYHSPPSSGGGGSHTPTPHFDPTPSTPPSGGSYTPTVPPFDSTPSSPSTGGGYYHSPPSSGGGGGHSTPVTITPPSTPLDPGTPYINPGSPSTPGIPSPSSPWLPDPNAPPFFTGTCNYWKTHPEAILAVLGWWGGLGGMFGAAGTPALGTNLSLQQALFNTRTDGIGALYREGAASLLNSMINKKFPFTTKQVKEGFAAAFVSDKAAQAQAQLFQLANEGRLKP